MSVNPYVHCLGVYPAIAVLKQEVKQEVNTSNHQTLRTQFRLLDPC